MSTLRLIPILVVLCGSALPAAAGAHLSVTGNYEFAAVRVGQASTKDAVITNMADATEALTLTASLEGAEAASYHLACPLAACTCVADVCTGTRAPGESLTLRVIFAPTSVGEKRVTLRLANNDPQRFSTGQSLFGTGTMPTATRIQPAALSIHFGAVEIGGDSLPAPVAIRNDGNAPLAIASASLIGADPARFAIYNGPLGPQTLSPNATQTWTVLCRPISADPLTAVLRIAHDAPFPGNTLDIDLDCIGGRPHLTVDPPGPIDFGSVKVGTPFPVRTITVADAMNAAAPLRFAARVDGPGVHSFTLDCPPGAGCTCDAAVCRGVLTPQTPARLALSFDVAAPFTTRHAVMTIESNDPDAPLVTLDVTGTVTRPLATLVAPAPPAPPIHGGALDFPAVRNGGTSAPQSVTLRNDGDAPMLVWFAFNTNAAAFDLAGPTSVTTILPGATQDWTVACAPEGLGLHEGQIQIRTDALNDDGMIDVGLTCTSVEAVLAITGADPVAVGPGDRIDFGGTPIGGTRTTTVTVTNSGQAAATIGQITLASPTEGFAVRGLSSNVIGPGMTASFTVEFTPVRDAPGATVLTVDTDWNDPTVDLIGDGLQTGLVIQPLPIDLGEVGWDQTGDRVITVFNSGEVPFTVTAVTPSGADADQFQVIGVVPTVLGDFGAHTAYTVRAVPSDATLGVRHAMLTITTTLPGAGAVTQVPLTFASVGPMVALDPGLVVDFGDVDVDEAAGRTLDLVLTNHGGGPMIVTGIGALAGVFSKVDPAGTTAAANGGTLTIPITFRPTLERAELATFTITTTGLYQGGVQGPATLTITVRGRGVDQHLQVADVRFPDTYRDPTDAQVPTTTCGATHDRPCALDVCNPGAAPLHVSMLNDPDDAFVLASTAALAIGPGACERVGIAFRPARLGVFTGTVTILDDDDQRPMAEVHLEGAGVLRPVAVLPAAIAPITVAPGEPLRLSDVLRTTEGLRLTSSSTTDTFAVRLRLDDDDPDRDLATVVGEVRPLAAMQSATYDLAFDTRELGDHTIVVELFLDEDRAPQARRTIALRVEPGCGCRTSGPSGTWPIALALLVGCRRWRRRRA